MMRNGTASTESEKAIQLARAQAEKVFPAADETQKRESQATALVKLAIERATLFHNGEDCFARIPAGDHDETYPLKSRGVRRWLTHLYFEREQTAPGGDAVRCAIETLAGHALFEGEANKTFVRIAEYEGALYIDLSNARWRVIKVDADGWDVIESKNCPVYFRRAHGMLPLPTPERDGSIGDLREFLNVAGDDDFRLLISYLIGCFRARGPYPILVLHGEQGAAKSSATKILRSLIDPNMAALRSEPRDPRDLMIAANNGWIVALDNLSHLQPWLSDNLCRLSTGGGFSTRMLYENDEEMIFDAQRPVILNGIEEIATRGDLLDRAIIAYLPRIPDRERKTEEQFNAAFNAARPRLLGALLDAVSGAMRCINGVTLDRLPRMADFAKWVTAAEPALGWESGSFIRAYTENREAANELTLEASPITAAIRALKDGFTGTATELLVKLEALIDEKVRALKTWPKSGRTLSNTLRRLAANLAATGIEVSFKKPSRETGARRLITITRSEGISSSPSTPSSPVEQKQGVSGDDSGDDGVDSRDSSSPLATPKKTAKSRTEDDGVDSGDDGVDGDAKIHTLRERDARATEEAEIDRLARADGWDGTTKEPAADDEPDKETEL